MSDKKAVTCETWLCVDDEGNWTVGTSPGEAQERFEEEHFALSETCGFRLVAVSVHVPLPTVPALKGVAPDIGEASLESVS
jgi:hypothetical protein